MKKMSVSGIWNYFIPDNGKDISFEEVWKHRESFQTGFQLPGSGCEQKIGKKQEYYDSFCKEAIRAPREKWEYIGAIYLQKEIEIPMEWEGKNISLYLERINMASQLWIDEQKIGRQILGLSTPHCYELPNNIKAGKHIATLCIDNRNLINCDYMASGYSIDTQGYWNGIIGKMELHCEEVMHLSDIQVYPQTDSILIKVVEASDVYTPCTTKEAEITITVITPDKKRLQTKRFPHKIYQSKQVAYYTYELEKVQVWDEFTPVLYEAEISFLCEGMKDIKTVSFGMRKIERRGKELYLNDRPLSLRGTIHCAIFPKTGYPDMDEKSWIKNLSIIKSYGLNHVRFHAWCPPEAAFVAADKLGIYLGVEMPFWLNRDCCALETGEDSIHRTYYMEEAFRISKTYGNHPSFLLFSNGNELMGDFDLLNDISVSLKAYDARRIYTLTSNFDHPVLPCEDYLAAFCASGFPIRIQDLHDRVAEDTCLTYQEAVEATPLPIISFETGQYCVYPDVEAIEKYTGNMLPVNFDVVKKSMLEKGVYEKREAYVRASGDLAVKLYKEDMEAVYRTEKMAGYQLLSLTDYTGQSTATVGILDAFFDSKQIVKPETWREFCSEVVPLWKAKRIFSNDEWLEAELGLYDFGKEKIEEPVYEVTIYHDKDIFYHCKQKEKKLRISLESLHTAAMLVVEVKVGDYKNHWQVYVYPKESDETLLPKGVRLVTAKDFIEPIPGNFIPVFWSPVHFPSQKACGAIMKANHPIFMDFPTGQYPDYQWKSLLEHSVSMDISKISGKVELFVEIVPNYCDNTIASPLFMVEENGEKCLYCGFDLERDDLPTRQLKKSIFHFLQKFSC